MMNSIHIRYRTRFFSLILGLVSLNLSAQINFLEFEWTKETTAWNLYPVDSTGFYVTNYQLSDKPNTLQKNIALYDQDFQLQHQYALDIDSRFEHVKMWDHNQGELFLLYQKTQGIDLFLMRLTPDGSYEKHDVPLLETMLLEHFQTLGDKVLIGGLLDNQPAYFLFNLKNDRLTALERFYQPGTKLIQSSVDKKDRVISTLTCDTFSDGRSTFTLRNYDYEGKLLRTTSLKPTGFQNLNSATITNFRNGEQFVIGNYTNANLQGTTGVYLAKIEPNGDQKFNLIPYFQMEGYYGYMPEEKAQRKMERAKKKSLKKGGWSTSDELILNAPQVAGNRIHAVAILKKNSRYYRNHLIFNTSLELMKGVSLPDFNAKYYWTYQNEFFALGLDKQLQLSRSNAQEVKLYSLPIDLRDGSEDIYISLLQHWYHYRLLMGYSYEKNGKNYYAITSQSID